MNVMYLNIVLSVIMVLAGSCTGRKTESRNIGNTGGFDIYLVHDTAFKTSLYEYDSTW